MLVRVLVLALLLVSVLVLGHALATESDPDSEFTASPLA
jgi:hypothetical protein